MSIKGVGTDIVAVGRIEDLILRYGPRFLDRCFRAEEVAYIESRGRGGALSAAARWAAKEAFLKALGTDVQTLPYHDVEVRRQKGGPVSLVLHGKAATAAAEAGISHSHLALSHEQEYAVATVILEGGSDR